VVGKEELLGLRKREDPTSSIMCMNLIYQALTRQLMTG
jgi:hypothetical protein